MYLQCKVWCELQTPINIRKRTSHRIHGQHDTRGTCFLEEVWVWLRARGTERKAAKHSMQRANGPGRCPKRTRRVAARQWTLPYAHRSLPYAAMGLLKWLPLAVSSPVTRTITTLNDHMRLFSFSLIKKSRKTREGKHEGTNARQAKQKKNRRIEKD